MTQNKKLKSWKKNIVVKNLALLKTSGDMHSNAKNKWNITPVYLYV